MAYRYRVSKPFGPHALTGGDSASSMCATAVGHKGIIPGQITPRYQKNLQQLKHHVTTMY